MREQTTKVKTARGRKRGIVGLCIGLVLVICASFYYAFFYVAPYEPPAFETEVRYGIPSPGENMGYSSVPAPYDFVVALCGTMYQQEDGSLVVYLTNPEYNLVNISCEITNEAGQVLYKSGAIAPGEYVERLYPQMDFPNEAMDIEIAIYAYEPDTWYSAGSVTLKNTLQAY